MTGQPAFRTRRRHPAEPPPARPPVTQSPPAAPSDDDPLVPLSTRVPKSLKRRLKLAAVEHDTSEQDLIIAALTETLGG